MKKIKVILSLVLAFLIVATPFVTFAEFSTEMPLLNGNFEEEVTLTNPGEGRPDLVRAFPANWEVFGPTNGDVQKQGDLDPLMGKKAGQSVDGFATNVDMKIGNCIYSGGKPAPINPLSVNADEQKALFIDSYINPGVNVWSEPIAVSENNIYRFKCEYYSAGIVNPGVRFFDENGNVFKYNVPVSYTLDTKAASSNVRTSPYTHYINLNSALTETKNKWSTYEKDFIAPKGAVSMRVAFTWNDTGAGINGKFLMDNVKVSNISTIPVEIYNSTFDNNTNGFISSNAIAIVSDPASIADGTNNAPLMRENNVLSIPANGKVETDFIDMLGGGKYILKFDSSAANDSTYKYSMEFFDKNHKQLSKEGVAGSDYAADLALLNEKSVVGKGYLQTREISSNSVTSFVQDVYITAPANTAYAKLYFSADATSELLIDNLYCSFVPQTDFSNIINTTFVDENGLKITKLQDTTATKVKVKSQFVNLPLKTVPFIGAFALYEKNTNMLKDLKFISNSTSSVITEIESDYINVPENPENYYYKLIVFDSIDNLSSYAKNDWALK